MYKNFLYFFILIGCCFYAISSNANNLALDKIKLPPGFHITLYADNVAHARELAVGDKGTVFVGSGKANTVYAILPNTPGNKGLHKTIVIAKDLSEPVGVAYYKKDLYVATKDNILRYTDIENHLQNPPSPMVIFNKFPKAIVQDGEHYDMHYRKYIKFSPDGWLYVAIGVICDHCLPQNPLFATIIRMRPDGGHMEIFAKGVRNSEGMALHPITQQLWFTDISRIGMGDNLPPDKLNVALQPGMHFGYPYYHDKNLPDPNFGILKPSQDFTPPVFTFPAHITPMGISFYQGKQFPKTYQNALIVCEHGSWFKSEKIGYRLTLIKFANNKVISYQPFATGWLQDNKSWGRPVDNLVMPDGSLLVSDNDAGVIYHITYQAF